MDENSAYLELSPVNVSETSLLCLKSTFAKFIGVIAENLYDKILRMIIEKAF